jgi:hypothetical protein
VVEHADVEDIAEELGAPWMCVLHQVENHSLARLAA